MRFELTSLISQKGLNIEHFPDIFVNYNLLLKNFFLKTIDLPHPYSAMLDVEKARPSIFLPKWVEWTGGGGPIVKYWWFGTTGHPPAPLPMRGEQSTVLLYR